MSCLSNVEKSVAYDLKKNPGKYNECYIENVPGDETR